MQSTCKSERSKIFQKAGAIFWKVSLSGFFGFVGFVLLLVWVFFKTISQGEMGRWQWEGGNLRHLSHQHVPSILLHSKIQISMKTHLLVSHFWICVQCLDTNSEHLKVLFKYRTSYTFLQWRTAFLKVFLCFPIMMLHSSLTFATERKMTSFFNPL